MATKTDFFLAKNGFETRAAVSHESKQNKLFGMLFGKHFNCRLKTTRSSGAGSPSPCAKGGSPARTEASRKPQLLALSRLLGRLCPTEGMVGLAADPLLMRLGAGSSSRKRMQKFNALEAPPRATGHTDQCLRGSLAPFRIPEMPARVARLGVEWSAEIFCLLTAAALERGRGCAGKALVPLSLAVRNRTRNRFSKAHRRLRLAAKEWRARDGVMQREGARL